MLMRGGRPFGWLIGGEKATAPLVEVGGELKERAFRWEDTSFLKGKFIIKKKLGVKSREIKFICTINI
jgi:hypothetical protein